MSVTESHDPRSPRGPREAHTPHAPLAAPDTSRVRRPGPVVGFDLDMTLVDSRPGIRAAYQQLSAETGVAVDADLVVTRLGPPLEDEIANWFPAEQVEDAANRYRALYPSYAITPTTPLPGAREAVAAVRAVGGRVVVVTGKWEPNAALHLAHLGIEVDAVIGNVWAEGKAAALREHGASVYVGDHLGDVRGARAADALSVAVTTGPYGADALREAGADVVMKDLTAFPAWLAGYCEKRGADHGTDHGADHGADHGTNHGADHGTNHGADHGTGHRTGHRTDYRADAAETARA